LLSLMVLWRAVQVHTTSSSTEAIMHSDLLGKVRAYISFLRSIGREATS